MKNIRVLAIGEKDWIANLNSGILQKLATTYTLEKIMNEQEAIERLTHNSYDILILQDDFSPKKSIHLATLAYAMTRPTLILCNGFLKVLMYKLWKMFSNFTRKYKVSRKLIFFDQYNANYIKLIEKLAFNHLQYFNEVNAEVKKNTSNID
jgi:hypothetical protein